MAYIGAGLAVATFFLSYEKVLAEHRHFSKLLLLDGFGFCHGYFKTEPTVRRHQIPAKIANDSALRERFDSGLGRALWFVEGGDPERLRATINAFAPERRPELWAGTGLACTYACGVSSETIHRLASVAEGHRVMLALGSLLASHARHRAGNPAPHNDLASHVLAGLSSEQLHRIAENRLREIDELAPTTNGKPTWTAWIEKVRADLSNHLDSVARPRAPAKDSRVAM